MENKQKLTVDQIVAKLLDPQAFELERQKKAEIAKKKQERLEKKAAVAQPKPKIYYDVKVECMLPATLTFRILAEDAVQAAELIKGKTPNSISHRLVGRKELLLKVFDAGSCMVRHIKKLL